MMPRRVGLVLLTGLISLGVIFNVQAGDRKRSRRFTAPAPVTQGPPGQDDIVTLCPIFIAANYGSYCAWYAIKCVNGQSMGPCALYGACDLARQTPCACTYQGFGVGDGESVAGAADGFTGDLLAPATPAAKSKIKFPVSANESVEFEVANAVHKNVVVKATIPNRAGKPADVYLQLLSMTTTPQHPLDAHIGERDRLGSLHWNSGRQIVAQDKVDFEVAASSVTAIDGRTNVVVITFQGDDYVVMLKSN